MAEPTEADALLNEPVYVEHPAGRQVGLRFGNRTMVEVERLFGSVGQFEDELNAVRNAGVRAPLFSFLTVIRENRAEAMERKDFGAYLLAITKAYNQYWGPPGEPPPNSNGARPKRGRKGAASRGRSGTTGRS